MSNPKITLSLTTKEAATLALLSGSVTGEGPLKNIANKLYDELTQHDKVYKMVEEVLLEQTSFKDSIDIGHLKI